MLKQCFHRCNTVFAISAMTGFCLLFCQTATPAFEILGTGTDALIGGDLTDPEDDGDPEFDEGYNAIFDANHEPGFGSEEQDPSSAGAGESAFNVFDNILGPGNDKWCCGRPGGIDEEDPLWVSAQLPEPHFLTGFTVSSANDVPDRDPAFWSVQGSNDGENYTNIYVYDDDPPWDDRLQVILFSAGDDFPEQTTSYEYFRLATFDTINNQVGDAAYFQIGEIEFFGTPGASVVGDYDGDGTINIADIEILRAAVMNGDNSFDLTGDGVANSDDIRFFAEDPSLLNSWIGDSNGDGTFSSADFVTVFTAGEYDDNDGTAEKAMNSVWATGDWNGDGDFDSSDFVFAFAGGGFELGPRAAASAVPEPTSSMLVLMSIVSLIGMKRQRSDR